MEDEAPISFDATRSERRRQAEVTRAIGTDAIVYPSPGPSPLDVLPYTPEGKPAPGGFRLGVSPGMVKHQGTQTVLWAEQQFEERGGVFNISNLIKTDQSAGEGE